MLKKILTMVAGTTAIIISMSAFAAVKTSSLSVAKPVVNQSMPAQCQKMFNMADKLVLDAERQPGTHTQVAKMKNKLLSTKQRILKLETVMQQKSCDKGLTALNALKQKH